ncbi:hypothetical protein [Lysinibacillus sp. G4S2]|uniref:hypothetical protein n=1 Tax=Lysinibacillus sp. G4S2 TaxID=3055859 RepID=UPI0025A00EB9|nr:hypothetical protein [Lysinibacillus sp. G4S2]MDM5246334.1 hypothetical protein [Lysinibacillus sp. G4S2]
MIFEEMKFIKKLYLKRIFSDHLIEIDPQNKFSMVLDIDSDGFNDLYRGFVEVDETNKVVNIHQYEGIKYFKTPPSGFMRFLSFNNFPDGIYFEYCTGKFINFHIFELKLNPLNQYPKMAKQFKAGSIHCEMLARILGVENQYSIKYYTVYSKLEVKTSMYNYLNPPRADPGTDTTQVKKISDEIMSMWKHSETCFNMGNITENIKFKKIAIEDIGRDTKGYRLIRGRYEI